MSKTIKLDATIKKVSREDGKVEATMQVLIPASSSTDIPMGAVKITIDVPQLSMLDRKPLRGDKG